MRKQDRKYIDKYDDSTKESIWQCYKNPSRRKLEAEILCKMKMQNQNGYGFKILSYNTCQFTCGWLTSDFTLHVETPTRSIEIDYLPF